jgi:hypothetical protein
MLRTYAIGRMAMQKNQGKPQREASRWFCSSSGGLGCWAGSWSTWGSVARDARDSKDWADHQREFLTRNLLTPATLRLTPGAMVMLTVNKNESGKREPLFVKPEHQRCCGP